MNELTAEMAAQNPEKALRCVEKHIHAYELDKDNPIMHNFNLVPTDPVGSRIHFFAIEIYAGKGLLIVTMSPEEINNEEFEERKKRSDRVANWFSEPIIQRAYKGLMLQMIRVGFMWTMSEQQKEALIKIKD